MKKYLIETKWPKPRVREIEIDNETDKFVFVKGRRIGKYTAYHIIFDSFHEAKSELIAHLNRRVDQLEKDTNKVRSIIGELLLVSGPDK